MNSKIYKAVIIGAGRIGSQFDNPKSKETLTHAHAYLNHPSVKLSGIMDVDFDLAKREADKWGTEAFNDLGKMFVTIKPDIVSITTPDSTHFSILSEVLKYDPKIIFCEKPIVFNQEEANKLKKLLDDIKIPIVVNYSRRFDPSIRKLKLNIESGVYGKVISASGIYTKGLFHNGSHIVDLARFLFGEMLSVSKLGSFSDYDIVSDPSIDAYVTFERCQRFHLMTGDERFYSIFELDILFEKKRVIFNNFGFNVNEQEVIKDPIFKGFNALGGFKSESTSLINAMDEAVRNIVENLETQTSLNCTAEDALRVYEICVKIVGR